MSNYNASRMNIRALTDIVLTYLFKGITSDGLESLVHVDGLFCTGFKVWNITFALTPRLCPLCSHL